MEHARRSARPEAVEELVRDRLGAGEKLMGFGHRVYKTEDPRATHLRKLLEALGELAGDTTGTNVRSRWRRLVLEVKGLYPNVDFYAATRLPLARDPDRPVHADLRDLADRRLDRARHRAARRQPADPPGQRVHRRAGPEVGADRGSAAPSVAESAAARPLTCGRSSTRLTSRWPGWRPAGVRGSRSRASRS